MAELDQIQSRTTKWENELDSVKLEQLQISYQEGLALQSQIGVAKQNLQLLKLLISQVRSDHQLSTQINLMTALGDLNHAFSDIPGSLLSLQIGAPADAQKLILASKRIGTIANEEMGQFYLDTYQYVMDQADAIQRGCAVTSPPNSSSPHPRK